MKSNKVNYIYKNFYNIRNKMKCFKVIINNGFKSDIASLEKLKYQLIINSV